MYSYRDMPERQRARIERTMERELKIEYEKNVRKFGVEVARSIARGDHISDTEFEVECQMVAKGFI